VNSEEGDLERLAMNMRSILRRAKDLKPLTLDEAEAALQEVEPTPLSEERIASIAERLITRSKQGASAASDRVRPAQRKEASGAVPVRVPQAFHHMYERFKELTAMPFDGLDNAGLRELREAIFQITRCIVRAFDRSNTYFRGTWSLKDSQLETVLDLLLDGWKFSDPGNRRRVLERSMQTIVRIREALTIGDVGGAFTECAALILNASEIERPESPSRIQLLVTYAVWLWLAGRYDEAIHVNQQVANRCNAIANARGEAVLDCPPEFEAGETLRRVRTYAEMNIINCLFFQKLTTATEERFVVHDYDTVASLVDRSYRVLEADPEAGDFIYEELLVFQAHLARAAEDAYRSSTGEMREWWRAERDRRYRDLRDLVNDHFLVPDNVEESARLLIAAADAGEGCAVSRTIEILADALRDGNALVQGTGEPCGNVIDGNALIHESEGRPALRGNVFVCG
jgi:hypothetical protein